MPKMKIHPLNIRKKTDIYTENVLKQVIHIPDPKKNEKITE